MPNFASKTDISPAPSNSILSSVSDIPILVSSAKSIFPESAREVRVPTDVIALCAAPVTVAAVPLVLPVTLPVTLPVNGPAKPVAVKTPVLELKVRLLPLLGAMGNTMCQRTRLQLLLC